ncbi:MAG TPA: Hsp20/alpha crystallin family protein [Anaeromyxobacteraceae bacterium]|nr:Hsp20/alpha crystallin family protein [Anaeromyxobacteraceae bacterium]
MANLIRRQSSGSMDPSRAFDPFEVMRDLIGWDPFAELGTGRGVAGFVPSFDVKETKDAYVFTADLPGVRESDLELSLTGSRLTISGRREEEKKEEDDRWYAYERRYGSFSRAFTLPDGIDGDHVQADLKDGVLRVTVPKKPEMKPRKIELKQIGGGDAKA